jgi:hypothetical protein
MSTASVMQKDARAVSERAQLDAMHINVAMPTALGAFKDHSLYALERFLLKYEAIAPDSM